MERLVSDYQQDNAIENLTKVFNLYRIRERLHSTPSRRTSWSMHRDEKKT